MTFLLDARIELSPDEQDLIGPGDKYGVLDIVVYDSDARAEYDDAAYRHAIEAGEGLHFSTELLTALQYSISTLWSVAASLGNTAMAALSLRVTFRDLIEGVHVECPELEPILQAEKAIEGGAGYLAKFIATALTYDGREELYEL